MKVRLIFTTQPGFFSWLIRVFTFSKFSHVSFQISQTEIIDATFKSGVSIRPLSELVDKATVCEVVELDIDSEDILVWANTQVGKPYDIGAVVALPFTRKWTTDDKWFCSEFVSVALYNAGVKIFNRDHTSRITPEMLYNLDLEFLSMR